MVGSSGVSAVLLPQEASASVKIVQAKIANNLFFIRVSSFVSEFRCVLRNEHVGKACVSADCSERLVVFSLSKINDLIITKSSGKIQKIIVPGRKNLLLSCENLEIDYNKIVKIGDDLILVDTKKKNIPDCEPVENICQENFNEFSDD